MRDRAGEAAAQWARERPDLDALPMVVIGRLLEAAQLIQRDGLAPFLAAHGLQHGEFDVLMTLRRAGQPYRLTPTALYEAAMISSGGMTGRLDRLEKAGLVARHANPTDRRGLLVGLTDKGRSLIDSILAPHIANEDILLSGLDRSERQALDGLLAKLLAGLPHSGG